MTVDSEILRVFRVQVRNVAQSRIGKVSAQSMSLRRNMTGSAQRGRHRVQFPNSLRIAESVSVSSDAMWAWIRLYHPKLALSQKPKPESGG